ncbi:MAG: DUF1080 domain-containing protein [Gammaproteobacteria bacterium]
MNLSHVARMGILGAALALAAPLAAAGATGWTPLFNGKDLSGWSSYVSWQPLDNRNGPPASVRGVNNDPKKVFSVVDGMIRVSGEEWGGLSTAAEYERFHLKFEFKWGSKKWPPREHAPRDSGVLYFAVGPQGAQSGHWMRSHEFQLQEGDCGDYHSLDGVTVDAHVGDAHQGDWKFFRYAPELPLKNNIAARILKLGNPEKPSGQWNTMEIIADGATLIHIVNGKEVLRAYNSRQTVDGKSVPLQRGKFEIQSEGAEAFYRNIVIKPLDGPAAREKF